MKVNNLTKVFCLLAVAALSAGSVPAAEKAVQCTCVTRANWSFSSEASQLLNEIRSDSYKLTVNADRLRSFSHGISWQTHAGELTQVREVVNTIGGKIERLQAIRHAIEPWQQQALDSITKAGVTVASGTESAIQHVNENRNLLWADTYKGHLTTLAIGAGQMNRSVSVHLDLANTQEKLEGLRQQAARLGS